jgi:membrane-associated phospholipid phosphatase
LPRRSELPALLEYARDTQIAEPQDLSRAAQGPSVSFFARYRLAVALFGAQFVVLAVAAPGYSAHGLEIAWRTITPQVGAQVIFAFLWWHFRKYSTHPTKHIFRDVVLAAALLVLLTDIASPAQYVAIALKRPLIDSWLARGDAALGVHVPALVLWTSAHRKVSLLLTFCYVSLLPQFLLPLLFVGLWKRNRAELWEYIFHFHFCLLVTVASLALFPAACAFQYYGFTATLTETRFIAQFNGVRAGTFHIIRFNDLEGLISMPSFHVAGAVMVTWACRKYRYLLIPLVVLNTGLIASTVLSGAHYFIDIVASFALFATSVVVYRCWGARLVDSSAPLA